MTANGIPEQLSAACPDVALAGPADLADGVQARFVAAPASTTAAAALLRAAAELDLTVVPRGSGSKLDWGAPPASCDLLVDTGRLNQVLEHAAGDLVVTAQAGALLTDVTAVLATAGQRLALDPPGPGPDGRPGGTVGGLIATGAAGPLRYRYGSPRDLLIGITVVRADGAITKSGGKVVKNVAGYDLGKLFAGSFGTLGLITEATFRLHPAPERGAWVTLECADPDAAAAAVRVIADSPLVPAAIELSWTGAGAPLIVSALLEGSAESVTARADRLDGLLARGFAGTSSAQTKRADRRPGDPALGGHDDNGTQDRVRASGGEGTRVAGPGPGTSTRTSAGGTVVRVGFWAGQLAAVLTAIRAAGAEHGVDPAVSGSAGAGVLEVGIGGAADSAVAGFVTALRAALGRPGGVGEWPPSASSAVVVRAPAGVRDLVDLWGPVPSLELMRAVKNQFDPEHRMAPGRFAGGI
jgi:glycolate oxidase FAD binding subunit